jgi:hypothetical protein
VAQSNRRRSATRHPPDLGACSTQIGCTVLVLAMGLGGECVRRSKEVATMNLCNAGDDRLAVIGFVPFCGPDPGCLK